MMSDIVMPMSVAMTSMRMLSVQLDKVEINLLVLGFECNHNLRVNVVFHSAMMIMMLVMLLIDEKSMHF
jgi:hypothetical protein